MFDVFIILNIFLSFSKEKIMGWFKVLFICNIVRDWGIVIFLSMNKLYLLWCSKKLKLLDVWVIVRIKDVVDLNFLLEVFMVNWYLLSMLELLIIYMVLVFLLILNFLFLLLFLMV